MEKQQNTGAGTIVSVNIGKVKGLKKQAAGACILKEEHGVEGDAHAGGGVRQVSLLAQESIDKIRALGMDVGYGDFAENLTTHGVILHTLPWGRGFGWGTACSWSSRRSARSATTAAPSSRPWATASCPGRASSSGWSRAAR